MYENIKRLYKEGKLSLTGLQNAVNKGWITEEQLNMIVKEVSEIKNNI